VNDTETTRVDDPTGGPAFPCATGDVLVDPKGGRAHIVMRGGMSLRDWFAGQALVGTLSQQGDEPHTAVRCEAWARWAYDVADAMLAARKAVQP